VPAFDAMAQNHQPTVAPVGALQPVPRHGTQIPQPASDTNAQSESWRLQWRRNPKAPTQVQPQSQPVQPVAHQSILPQAPQATTPRLQVVSTAPELQSVSQATWLSHPQRSDDLVPPSRGKSTDAFTNPFGDDPAPRNSAVPVATSPQQSPPDLNFPVPDPQADAALPSDNRPMNELRSGAAENTSESLFDSLQSPDEPELTLPEPPQAKPKSAPQLTPREDGPSLGDMLRDNDPQQDAKDESDESNAKEPDAELPPPKRALDRSDDEDFDTNPFDRLRDDKSADERDRDRLNAGEDKEDPSRSKSDRSGLDDEDDPKPKAITCADFRERIKRETIDRVSLDISPPYRPDEIDMERYEKLKARFDEKQSIRQWRSIDGRELAAGRLRDLAYEKAVIETQYGAVEELPINRLSEADLAYISENWGLPNECLIEQVAYTPRNWTSTTMTWRASNLCHSPLYFEDVNLERYGHTHGPVLEPIVQSAHFFANIAVLPYKMGVHAPHECQYALGYYRPGSCAPWIKPPVPLSARGAIAQAATMTGLFWLIP
jgi:hypothetical protein